VVASNSSKINSSTNIISKTFSYGVYSWGIKCSDKNGNNSTSPLRNLTILSNVPNVTLITPQNGYTANGPIAIQFEYMTTNYNNITSCNLFLNGDSVESNLTKITNTTNVINKTISVGIYTWFVKCTDKSGNFGVSSPRDLVVLQDQTNSSQGTNQTNSSATVNSTTTNNTDSDLSIENISESQNTTVTSSLDLSSGQNPSSGGGGGGGGGSCATMWNCSEWGDCEGDVQTRNCSYPVNWCKPVLNKPEEKRNCAITLSNLISNDSDDNSKNLSITPNGMDFSSEKEEPKGLFGITGAAIGIGKPTDIRTGLMILGVVLVMFALVYYLNIKKSKNHKKNNASKRKLFKND